jgi:hypothetical protein
MDKLKESLPTTEYNKIYKLYQFSYNVFLFIYKTDNSLIVQYNFILNYILYKYINEEIMHVDLCYGKSNVVFINSIYIFYIKIAGVKLILENIMIEYKNSKFNPAMPKVKYSVSDEVAVSQFNDKDVLEGILEDFEIDYVQNYLKIIFYIELFNKDNIPKDLLNEIKKKLQKSMIENSNKTVDNKIKPTARMDLTNE